MPVAARAYEALVLLLLAVAPAAAIAYLKFYQSPALLFEDHAFHELAIAASTLVSGFTSYITWRSYRASGKPFLRWLALAMLAFTLIYVLHGVFTRLAGHNMLLFLLYGPVSRLTMAALLVAALLHQGLPADAPEERDRAAFWWRWMAVFAAIDAATGALAWSNLAGPGLRVVLEGACPALLAASLAMMARRRIRGQLMTLYALALAFFAQASIAFLLATPWNHMWWLAHSIFAAGFFILGFGVARAYRVTQSFSDVYNQEELVQRLRQAKQRAEFQAAQLTAANEELESFVHAVSHDLRAPLRAMSGLGQALVEDYRGDIDETGRTYIEQIGKASRHSSELVDALLTLSRATRGELGRERVDVSALAERIRDELTVAEPGRAVDWQIESGLSANGDVRMIEVVLRNLIGNAWKYTGRTERPAIRVFGDGEAGQRWVCVADNGAGFDMALAPKLFKPFQRLHRLEEFPGVGIGLATVQRIVHRHGGAIRAEAAPGRGATFRFLLPDSELEAEPAFA
jgi:signal transduction histidine kinase